LLPVILFGTGATFLFANMEWLGASGSAVACIGYTVVAWKRLHGNLSYAKPPPILELRRRLKRP